MNTIYKLLPIQSLQPGRYQPRLHFDESALNELASSIKSQGLIEPLVVREIALHRYEIIAGERRWRAAIIANMDEIPCLIGHYSDRQAASLTLIENIQREELNLIEEATGYARLKKEFNFQQDEIALLVSKSRSHIANILRLLTLDKSVQQQIIKGNLALGHARLLVNMAVREQCFFTEQVIEHQWSVRTLEEKIKVDKTGNITSDKKSADIRHLETSLAEQMGAPVQIINENGQGGWLQIKFFDNETLVGLLERMGMRYD